MKRMLSVFLAVVLLLSLVPAGAVEFAFEAKAATSGYYTYTVSNGEATITDVSVAISGDMVIPSALGGYPVTSIWSFAFSWCSSLTTVTIPDSVTSIGTGAFIGCDNLVAITVGGGNTVYHSDRNCVIHTADKRLVVGCRTSVIPSDGSVTSIGDYAFYGTSLMSVTIPDSVTSIGREAFSECYRLAAITVDGGNTVYHSDGNCVIHTADKRLVVGCNTSVIPSDGSVTSIGDSTFFGCTSLTSVTIPDSVTSIGREAFSGCTWLTSVTIGDSVTSIGELAFSNCKALTDVYYGGSEADRAKITIGSYNTTLTSATWHYTCDHTSTTVSGYVAPTCTEDGYTGDTGCADCDEIIVTGEIIPAAGHNYGDDNLCGVCGEDKFLSYYTYTVTDGKATITGVNTGISGDVVLPSTLGGYPVTGIGYSAFKGCTGLTAVTIPDSVTYIGQSAFYSCTALTTITLPNNAEIASGAFSNTAYCNDASNWKDGVLYIDQHLIKVKDTLSGSYTVMSGTKTIARNAFSFFDPEFDYYGCAITSLTIPDSVTRIGGDAFCGCTELAAVYMGSGVTNIGSYAFYDCYRLTNVYYGGGAADRAAITLGEENGWLTAATWHYDYCIHAITALEGVVAGTCTTEGYTGDTVCTACGTVLAEGETVPADHVYDGDVCRLCGETRNVYAWINIDQTTGQLTHANLTGIGAQEVSLGGTRDATAIGSTGRYGIKLGSNWGGFWFNVKGALDTEDDVVLVLEYYIDQAAPTGSVVRVNVAGNAVYGVESHGLTAQKTSLLVIPLSEAQKTGLNNDTPCYVTGAGAAGVNTYILSLTIADTQFAHAAGEMRTALHAGMLTGGMHTATSGAVDATCSENGYTGDTVCTLCGEILAKNGEVIPTIEHTYGDDGLCDVCGADKRLEYYYTYTVNNGEATITDVDTAISGAVTIPSALGGYPVTSIEEYAFEKCRLLTSVTIPDSVTSIGAWAFSDCISLQSVTIPGSVTRIGDLMFQGCVALTSVTILDGVTYIGNYAFWGCNALTLITIPDSVMWIGMEAFEDCGALTDVCYGGDEADLANMWIYDGNADLFGAIWHYNWCNHVYGNDGVCNQCGEDKLEYYTYTVSNGEATIIDVDTAISGAVTIPSTLGGYPVTSIGGDAFGDCRLLTSVIIPDSVTEIGRDAFQYCTSLLSVTIPESVRSIGSYAFSYNKSLKAVHITNLTAWCNIDFYDEIANPLSWGEKLYLNGELVEHLTLPQGITDIKKHTFTSCSSLTSIVIPEGVESVGEGAFYGCHNVSMVTLPDSVKTIGKQAFCYVYPNVYYGGDAIDRANILIGSDNDDLIYASWHYTCKHRNTTLGNTVSATCTTDGYTGDTLCVDCGEVLATGGEIIPAAGHNFGDDNLCDACGEDTMRDYYTATVTDGKLTITDVDTAVSGKITIPAMIDGCPVVAIGNNAFRDCKNITSITIPESVETIGNYAFRDCTALIAVYYNATNCTAAGVNAYPVFYGCTALTAAYIGKTVESVPPRLFREVTALTTVYLTKNTATIGANAFYLCGNLSSVHFVGTAGEFAAVDVKSYNTDLTNATFAYNAPCFDGHEWTAECDELCEFCGATHVTVHTNVVEDAAKAPTCTETGLTAGSHCEACGNVFEKQNVIPALGHTWDEGTVTVEPTYEACGYRRVTCTACGATELLEVPPLTRAEVRDGYYYYDGVKVPNAGLVKIHNDYYYVLAGAKVKTGRYSVFNTNGLDIPSGIYYFFPDGKMNLERGVYDNYYYNDQGKSEAYAGLIEWNGAKYYVNDGGNVTTGRYFISKLNDLLPKARAYTFYPDGKMLEETRIYGDGFYYENGIRVPYAGMVQYEGHWYYVSDNAAYVKNKQQILVNVNNSGLAKNARCYFDENGHMVTNKVVNGKYYDETGAAPSYAGVVKAVDGKLYYVGGTHGALRKSATFTISAAKTNGLCAAGKYTADENAVLTPAA